MFEFIFKRNGENAGVAPAATETAPSTAAAASAERREQQTRQAAALAGDEAAAVALILQSEFAGVRLQAAEHVRSLPQLEQVLQAMRNTDRRVAKLMQGRLDAIRYHEAEQRKAAACLELAARLLADEKLTPNQVAELDRQWRITSADAAQADSYASQRAALDARLQAQMQLQRQTIDALAALRQLLQAGPDQAVLEAAIASHTADYQRCEQAPEHAALPRHLLSDYAAALQQARAAMAASASAAPVAAPVSAGTVPGATAAAQTGTVADGVGAHDDAASAAPAAGAANVAQVSSQPAPAGKSGAAGASRAAKPAATDPQFLSTLDALEQALEQGLLHAAAEHDKWLKEHKSRLSPAVTERLNHLRAELKRLSDWARWSGNVSREELVKVVEELPALGLAMSELAKKVGSMRERWKALDAVSGHAPRSLWERFDRACTTAYAPAAAHFKQLADERHANASKAQALIEETRALAQAAAEGVDLKNVAAAGQRLRQMWTRLGAMERKEKRKLEQAFDKALGQLLAPLTQQRKIEVTRREQLIQEAEQLQPGERHVLDLLKRLQERWQEQAKALPLERKAEQALWQRFRAACDAVYNKRKEVAHAADHERKAHLHAREALCAQLETATFSGDEKAQLAAIAALLRETASAWQHAGIVPRAAEARISQRYQAAQAQVQAQADAIRRRSGAAQANALRDKLRLCQSLETSLAQGVAAADGASAAQWQERWSAVPKLGGEYEKALVGRFNAALALLGGDAGAYLAQLEANRRRLRDEVLRLEIVAGVDSGSEFARERLKMQVEVLQSSLKSGQKPQSATAAYLQLCAMPALADERTVSRIEALFRRIGGGER
ncbi:DUF349 domain-containing protein [Duganella qianjiadongensis]|uniref:DUF349 domain-containing protein n=1 Tax=Duganella qianjiadongensis TaxID=2692176 RepID=A0ABW9VPD0_9BURK|nr:DUF349 domain-containing protein [Duganella qianjiadongensis]MYM41397.1 DUF349 domain-containing protein [Duganella qianjiadongensis]